MLHIFLSIRKTLYKLLCCCFVVFVVTKLLLSIRTAYQHFAGKYGLNIQSKCDDMFLRNVSGHPPEYTVPPARIPHCNFISVLSVSCGLP